MSRRFQFSLKSLLWMAFCVACFFGGAAWDRYYQKPSIARFVLPINYGDPTRMEMIEMPDGARFYRVAQYGKPLNLAEFTSVNGELIRFERLPQQAQ